MVEIGDAIRFKPTAFMTEGALTSFNNAPVEVTGRVCYINYEHGFYRVRAEVEGGVLHECFKIY